MIEAQRVDYIAVPRDSGVCNGASFSDPDGNGIMINHRYAAYPDGTAP